MSKYTYHIKLGGSDYVEVFPANRIQIRGYWEDDSWFDRVELSSEVKICRKDNQSIYDSISSWRTDPAKYSTVCLFQVRSSGATFRTFSFNPRWGKIDYETAVYTFKPAYFDSYETIWKPNQSKNAFLSGGVGADRYSYYNETATNKPYVNYLSFLPNDKKLFPVYEDMLTNISGINTVESTILNGDFGAISVTTQYGIPLSYVTGEENFFPYSAISLHKLNNRTVEQIMDILKIFQIYPFFSEIDTIRLEHVYYMLYVLQNNAVSITFDDDENIYEFIDEKLPVSEKLSLHEDKGNTDNDFTNQTLSYTNYRIGVSGIEINEDHTTQFTDIDKWIAAGSDYTDNDLLICGTNQQIKKWTSTAAIQTFTNNQFSVADSGTWVYFRSNDFKVENGNGFSCYIDITQINGTVTNLRAELEDRSTGAIISTTSPSLSLGVNTFTLSRSGSTVTDACLLISFFASTSPAGIAGYATCRSIVGTDYRVVWQQGYSTSRLNGHFSQYNIIKKYWDYYRPTNSGTQRGDAGASVAFSATNSQFTYRRETKKRYYPNDINMKHGVNDGTRIAKIEQYTRDLDTDFVQFTLLYQEDE